MPGGVRLSGGPILSETEVSTWESEASSVIDIGDRCLPSESEDDLADKQKYRLPDVGKTRLNLLTKEPLSPSRRPVPQSPGGARTKMTTMTTPTTGRAPRTPASPFARLRAGSSENVNALSDNEYFPSGLSSAGSIYSLSRVSFAGQIAQLTSIRLPDATSLAKRISSIPTASEAAKSLSDASDQINLWIGKASEVLQGLNADDDVEWAAAGGRDGIEEVDQAINRFEKLVDVYILSIERLQTRSDAATLSPTELNDSVRQMESIVGSWAKIKAKLKETKQQVQLAIDWETLWNTDLGEIAQEMGQLTRYIFELEEKRHQGSKHLFTTNDNLDLNELESVLEGPGTALSDKNRPSGSAMSRLDSMIDHAESYTLGLAARMQPLRTSLDFLPMKLSTFHIRANPTFPTACKELQDRRDELEEQWTRIEADARALREELGDDKWVTVFRNAGIQASKICDSIERTLAKLKSSLDSNEHVLNKNACLPKIESYEAKKLHYTPAIERVLAIINRGIKDRVTINGDVLRQRTQLQQRWTDLQARTRTLDSVLAELHIDRREKQLRDSVSTILSSERSTLSSLLDTPGTSPASSVIGNSRKSSFHGSRTPTQAFGLNTPSTAGRTSDHRMSSSIPRKSGLFNRSSVADFRSTPSPAPSNASSHWPSRPFLKDDHKPKWNASTKSDKRDFAPLSKFEPSPYAKKTSASRLPAHQSHASVGRVVSEPIKQTETAVRRRSALFVPQTPEVRSPSALARQTSPSRFSITPMPTGRRSRLSTTITTDGNDADIDAPARNAQRPLSSLDRTMRRSIIPMRNRHDVEQAAAGAEKPRWR